MAWHDNVRVDALWTIRAAKGEPRTGRTQAREPAGGRDPLSMAAAHSRALDKVARDIAVEGAGGRIEDFQAREGDVRFIEPRSAAHGVADGRLLRAHALGVR